MMFPCEMVSRFQPHICMDREVDGLAGWMGRMGRMVQKAGITDDSGCKTKNFMHEYNRIYGQHWPTIVRSVCPKMGYTMVYHLEGITYVGKC